MVAVLAAFRALAVVLARVLPSRRRRLSWRELGNKLRAVATFQRAGRRAHDRAATSPRRDPTGSVPRGAAGRGPCTLVPEATNPSSTRAIALRADGVPPGTLTATLRSVVGELDPRMAVYRVSTLEELMAGTNESRRATTAVMTLFGVLALGLAAAGLYAVLAQSVVERRAEVGVRMALGAQLRDVVSLVVREGLSVVGIGLAIGLGAALLVGRGLRSSLYGVESTDLPTLLAAVLALLVATLVATLGPARRAARTDPVQTLRQE